MLVSFQKITVFVFLLLNVFVIKKIGVGKGVYIIVVWISVRESKRDIN